MKLVIQDFKYTPIKIGYLLFYSNIFIYLNVLSKINFKDYCLSTGISFPSTRNYGYTDDYREKNETTPSHISHCFIATQYNNFISVKNMNPNILFSGIMITSEIQESFFIFELILLKLIKSFLKIFIYN